MCHNQARLAHVTAEAELKVPFADELPSRQAQLRTLKSTEEFDVLIVGGGATGAGCALDAVTRSKFINPILFVQVAFRTTFSLQVTCDSD